MIILIGNRFGFFIPLFILLAESGVQAAVDTLFGTRYFEQHIWPWAIGLFLAAGVCSLLGQFLRGRLPPPEIDPKTGREPIPGTAAYARHAMREIEREATFSSPRDSFFFLPMFMWGPILAVIGFIVLLVGWLR